MGCQHLDSYVRDDVIRPIVTAGIDAVAGGKRRVVFLLHRSHRRGVRRTINIRKEEENRSGVLSIEVKQKGADLEGIRNWNWNFHRFWKGLRMHASCRSCLFARGDYL
ncbi:hypothetical protein SUGI_0943050 [Cryptomeria japonica]|nr:hypothetical protein SUGI_0943050 [Cryptomeria japonica]